MLPPALYVNMKEFDLLKIVEEFFGHEDILIPAGKHDAAYVRANDKFLVLTCDTVNEKSDFPRFMKAEEMGYMAASVTLSDIAACGAKPLFFLNAISMKEADFDLFKRILIGIKDVCSKYGVKVAGGDIDFSETLTISGFAVGEAKRIITRNSAKPGENVYVTGLLGKAQLCLELLEKGFDRESLPYPESLYKPEPRIREGLKISEYASALTDISDSLAVSAHLMARGSGVKIVFESIPTKHLENYPVDPLELFLYGGGDFELLYTAKHSEDGIKIGKVEEGKGVYLKVDEELKKVEFRGYSHF